MSPHHVGSIFWLGGILLVLSSSGCHSTSPGNALGSRGGTTSFASKFGMGGPAATSQAQNTALVRPGMELTWDLQTQQQQPGLVRAGRGVVGPDGALVLGPYGTCQVAGQTLEQARRSVEKHLANWVQNPMVHLSAALPSTTSGEIAWRPAAANGPGAAVASLQRQPGLIRPTTYQSGPVLPGKDNLPMPPPGKDDTLPILPMPQNMPQAPGTTYSPQVMGHPPMGSLPAHGMAPAPAELNRVILPPYVIGVSDVLLIESLVKLRTQPIAGPHLVRPDGTVSVGIYGSPVIAGLTIEQARETIARVIFPRMEQSNKDMRDRIDKEKDEKKKKQLAEDFVEVTLKDVIDNLNVDVLAYNSKVYYVITDGGGYGEQVYPFPLTGNETVLDALGKIYGLPWNASKKHIWVARRVPGYGHPDKKLPVDWIAITQHGATASNYQIMPGDRVYVRADRVRAFDAALQKFLSPIERLLGVTLLGSQTVNSIRSGTVGGSGR
jgi:polysaccharide export outer membrane protein